MQRLQGIAELISDVQLVLSASAGSKHEGNLEKTCCCSQKSKIDPPSISCLNAMQTKIHECKGVKHQQTVKCRNVELS